MKQAAVCAALLLAAGCGEETDARQPQAQPAAAETAAPGLVATRVAELERAVAGEQGPPVAPTADVTDLEQRLAGLIDTMVTELNPTGETPLRLAALSDMAAIGDAAVPYLEKRLWDPETGTLQSISIADSLAKIGTVKAAEALLKRAEQEPDADKEREGKLIWGRQQALYRLGSVGQDWVVPRLLVRLARESSQEAQLWVCKALGQYDNLAGVDLLRHLARAPGVWPGVRKESITIIAEFAQARKLTDVTHLAVLWRGETPPGMEPRPEPVPSKRLELEVWKTIHSLSEWQLRGVDDARFVLGNMNGWVAGPLAEALGDENRYIRLHAAQALERMGPRGRAAGPALVKALDDSLLAAQAAAALGALEYVDAIEPLAQRVRTSKDLELRVAATRALGVLEAVKGTRSQELYAGIYSGQEPLELRVAAAEALVSTAPVDAAAGVPAEVDFLLAQMRSKETDPLGPERALERWIVRMSEAERPGASELWQAWRKLEDLKPSPGEPAREPARLEQRAAMLEKALQGLRGN